MIKCWLLKPQASGVSASGGTEYYHNGYKFHKFTNQMEYTKALLHFNGDDNSTTFTDEIGKTWTRSGDAHIHTGEKKFGTASGYFDGSGDNIHTPNHDDFEFGSGNFTIDFWVKSTQTTQYAALISKDNTSAGTTGQWCLLTSGSSFGSIQFYCYNYNNFVAPMLDTAGSLFNTNSWVHIALVRHGNVWTLYVNGVSRATRTSAITIANSSDDVYVGMHQYYSRPYLGYIDELRISKGIARWTEDFSGSLPTEEYSLVSTNYKLTVTTGGTVKYLIVAGGGGGGKAEPNEAGDCGGGGGAGGLLQNEVTLTAQEYSIVVGNGGVGSSSNSARGSNGSDSTFNSLTAKGGGGGGSDNGDAINNGANGGSGGGCASMYSGSATGGSPEEGQGYAGGSDSASTQWCGRGGGGAGEAGGDTSADEHIGTAGGDGYEWIDSLTYAGGGGGGSMGDGVGPGGLGGGGNGGNRTSGSDGMHSTGGGGGGAGSSSGTKGGDGGSGVVTIGYPCVVPDGWVGGIGGTESTVDGYKYHVFTESGLFFVGASAEVEVLVVAGGGNGGSGRPSGGGGAGGVLYESALALEDGEYTITVGGAAQNSSLSNLIVSTAGGRGSSRNSPGSSSGGSGGGGAGSLNTTHSNGIAGQGHDGADGSASSPYGSGGGGGAGGNGNSGNSGAGGVGTSAYSDLLIAANAGVDVGGVHYIAGGGGGSDSFDGATNGAGGYGGGGNGSANAVANTGGGGGGRDGLGGSGIVIIRYKFQ